MHKEAKTVLLAEPGALLSSLPLSCIKFGCASDGLGAMELIHLCLMLRPIGATA